MFGLFNWSRRSVPGSGSRVARIPATYPDHPLEGTLVVVVDGNGWKLGRTSKAKDARRESAGRRRRLRVVDIFTVYAMALLSRATWMVRGESALDKGIACTDVSGADSRFPLGPDRSTGSLESKDFYILTRAPTDKPRGLALSALERSAVSRLLGPIQPGISSVFRRFAGYSRDTEGRKRREREGGEKSGGFTGEWSSRAAFARR